MSSSEDPTAAFARYGKLLDNDTKLLMERGSFNFWELQGRLMQIPPALYEQLREGGVDMRYLEANEHLTDSLMPGLGRKE